MEYRLDPGMRPFLVLVAAGCLATITTSVANEPVRIPASSSSALGDSVTYSSTHSESPSASVTLSGDSMAQGSPVPASVDSTTYSWLSGSPKPLSPVSVDSTTYSSLSGSPNTMTLVSGDSVSSNSPSESPNASSSVTGDSAVSFSPASGDTTAGRSPAESSSPFPLSSRDAANGTSSELPAPPSELLDLHVVGLFGVDGVYPVGRAFQLAAELAEEDINRRPDVLPGYRLILEPVNTKCNTALGMDLLYQKLFKETSKKIMVLGGTCSHVTEQTALVSAMYNMLQISYSALSPRLSEEQFQWFFRVMAPENQLSEVRIQLLQHFSWTVITFIQASEHLFSSTVELMRDSLPRYSIEVNDTLPFEKDPENAIEQAKNNDARIIYFSAYEDQARSAVCAAYRRNLYGKKVVWIFPGFFDLKWYDHDDFNCTAKQKLEVIDGYLTVSNVNMAETEDGAPVGANKTEFLQRFQAKALRFLNASDQLHVPDLPQGATSHPGDGRLMAGEGRAPLAYDAMWAIALALNATLTHLAAHGKPMDELQRFTYDNRELGELIFRQMKGTMFTGLSGNVSFTATGDRIPQIAVKQFRVNQSTGEVELKVIGLYTDSNMAWLPGAVHWKGRTVPLSSRRTEHVLRPLSWRLYAAMCFLASFGVLLSVAFLVFNVRNRNVRLIKMSSPKINNFILLGCMMVYISVTLQDIHCLRLDAFCHVRLYLTVLGFSVGFGALFAKTWRVYEIMTASNRLSKVTKDLRDSRLLLTMCVLVMVNAVPLVVWTSMDCMTMTPVDIEDDTVQREDDVLEIGQGLVCQSAYKLHFTLGLLSLQALLILLGAFLAFQTRKMTITELNDSRWVGLCIYNVVVLGSLGAILVLGTRQSPHVAYLLESVIVIVGTTVTQCLVFVPKILAYRRLKQEGKTRRLKPMGVQAMCLSGGSSSPSLRSVSIASLPEPAPSLPPSADLSSRRASWDNGRFPLAVPWWCCSTETPDLGNSGNQQHDVELDDARGPRQRAENSTSPGRVSRAVSTCSIFSHLGEVNDPGKDTCVSSGSQGDRPMSSGSCDCCCEALENPYHEACRWSNALRPHSDLFGHRDVQLMFHADSGRACANEAMPGRDSRSPPCGHQHCCRCLCLTSGSESGWRRPLRRAVSHDVPGCGNSRLLTGCPCQNASRQFHLDACINGCPSPECFT